VVWRRDQHCSHATGNKRRKWMQVAQPLVLEQKHLKKRLLTGWSQTFVDTWKRVFLQTNAMFPPPCAPPPLPEREWKEWQAGGSSGGSSSLCVCSFNLLSDDLNEQYSFQFVAPSPSFGNFTTWDYRLPRCISGPLNT
jgi:hypothetical protein